MYGRGEKSFLSVLYFFRQMQNFSEIQQVFPQVEYFKDSGAFAPKNDLCPLPIWVGDFPAKLAKLYPADKEVCYREITLRVNGEWQRIVLRQEKDPEPEGFTCKQGEPCYVIKNNRLYLVKWHQHFCRQPQRKMTADDWDALLDND